LESSTQIQKKIFEDQEGGRPGGRNQGWMMREESGRISFQRKHQ